MAGEDIILPEEVFDSQAEADARLAELQNQYGNDIKSSNIETVEAGTVYEAELVTQNQNEYVVTDSLYVINRHGGNIYVWTLNELSAEEITEFKRTYKEINKDNPTDPSMTDVDRGIFIHGMDNEYLTGNHKLFTIVQREDGTWVAIMDSASTSHVIYGKFVPTNEYHLNVTLYNNISTWTVSGNVVAKGYDYKLTANGTKIVELESGVLTGNKQIEEKKYSYKATKKAKTYTAKGTGTKIVEIESGVLTGNKQIEEKKYFYNVTKKAKTYTAKGTGKKTVELESGVLTADAVKDQMEEFYALDLVRQKYRFVGGIGGDEEPNPDTGIDDLWVFTIGGISMIGLAATSINLKKKKEEE